MATPESIQETPPETSEEKSTIREKFVEIAKKGFYLYLPPVHFVIIYVIGANLFSRAQAGEIYNRDLCAHISTILIIFALLSPLSYAFFPKWWRNTIVYLICLVILNIILISEYESIEHTLLGPSCGEAAMALGLNWGVPFLILPFSGVIRTVIHSVQKRKMETESKVEDVEIPAAH